MVRGNLVLWLLAAVLLVVAPSAQAQAPAWHGSISITNHSEGVDGAGVPYHTTWTGTYNFDGTATDAAGPEEWWQPVKWFGSIDDSRSTGRCANGDVGTQHDFGSGGGNHPLGGLVRFYDEGGGNWSYSIGADVRAAGPGGGPVANQTFPVTRDYSCPEYPDESRTEIPYPADTTWGQNCGTSYCRIPLPAGQTPAETLELQGGAPGIEWNLTRRPVRLDVLKDPVPSAGHVRSDPPGIDCGSLCTAEYSPNEQVGLTATPAEGWAFDHWEGNCGGTSPTCSVTMDRIKEVRAVFREVCLPGFATRTYRARAPVPGPDIDLFRFYPEVRYCYTPYGGEVHSATTYGDIDWGLDTLALEQLGFQVRYDQEQQEVFWTGGRATFRGDFDIHFDWASLLFRAQISKKARDYVEEKLAKKIAALLKKNDYDEWERELVAEIGLLRAEVTLYLDKWLNKLDDVLPDSIARRLRDFVLNKFGGFLDVWEQRLKAALFLSSKDLGRFTAPYVVDQLVDFGFANNPNDFSLWSPEITATVLGGGEIAWTDAGYVNPFLVVDVFDESTTKRTPGDVAGRAVREAATEVDPNALAAGRASNVRLQSEPGTVGVQLTAAGASGASAAARRRTVIAKGRRTFRVAGWQTLKVRPTKKGRALLGRRRVVKATITVTYKPAQGRATKRSVRVKLRRRGSRR